MMTRVIKPHASLAFLSAQPFLTWSDPSFTGRLAFIVSTDDQAVPKVAQYGMTSGAGQQWIVTEMASSHCAPFMDRVTECVRVLEFIICS
jgi:hypothetical protein